MEELFEHLPKCHPQSAAQRSLSRIQYKNVYEAIRILLKAGADLRKNPRGYGGGDLNYLWLFAARYSDLPEAEAMMLFMMNYTKNFSASHWRSVARAVQDNKKWSPRAKQRIYSAMPPAIRRRVE